jgi:hypothetical protein
VSLLLRNEISISELTVLLTAIIGNLTDTCKQFAAKSFKFPEKTVNFSNPDAQTEKESNWNGVRLDSQELAECLGRNIIIATRKRSI